MWLLDVNLPTALTGLLHSYGIPAAIGSSRILERVESIGARRTASRKPRASARLGPDAGGHQREVGNVLVRAYREDAPQHRAFRTWLENAIGGDESFGAFDLVLSGFLRVVTHPRVFSPPSPVAHALEFAEPPG